MLWTHVAILRTLGFNQQALYCYGKVYGLDPSNLNALWDRAALAKEIGDNRTVRVVFTLGYYDVESGLRRKTHYWRCLNASLTIWLFLENFDLFSLNFPT